MFSRFKKDKSLGIARSRRRYDLPLNESGGSGFLRLLIGLMSILTMLALSTGFVLSDMTGRWAAGVQNHMTIEIPAEDKDGKVLPPEKVRALTGQVQDIAIKHQAIEEAKIMPRAEIEKLIAPWLGEDLAGAQDSIPLPGLITLTLKPDEEFRTDIFEKRLQTVSPMVRLDTHESWLKTVLRFTGALKFAAYFITLTILITTTVAVAGAIRTKMAVHKDELQLLHLMGALDSYIARQFQRHSMVLAFQGAMLGCLSGGFLLLLVGWIAGKMEIAVVPEFNLSGAQILLLCLLPFFISLLAMGTARYAVLRALKEMP